MPVADVCADVQPARAAVRRLMAQVQAEYAEMPGLSITLSQARRLWAVDQETCREAFERLVATGVLRITTTRRFVRA